MLISVQSPYVKIGSNDAQEKVLREEMESPHGDPFGLLNMFQEWISIKNSRREASYKWCRRHGLAEQRLYEVRALKYLFGCRENENVNAWYDFCGIGRRRS